MAMPRSVLFKSSFNIFKRSNNYSSPLSSAHASQSISDTKSDIDESIVRKKRRAREETVPISQI